MDLLEKNSGEFHPVQGNNEHINSHTQNHMTKLIHFFMDDRFFYIYVIVLAVLFNFLRTYQIFNAKVHLGRKIGAYIFEFLHNLYISGVIVSLCWMNVNTVIFGIYKIYPLLIVNIAILFAFLLFTYLRTCIFFLFFNRILGYHDCGEYNSIVDIFHGTKLNHNGKPDCEKNMSKWMKGIRILTIFVILLDIVYIEHYWSSG
jgi:hypothetical protein